MLAALLSLAATTRLQTSTAPQPEVSLVSDVSAVTAGRPFRIALHFKLPAEWHNYYLNPGESGLATKIAWGLPKGFKAGAIQWPVPERTEVQGIKNYEYSGDAWLFTTITPPSHLPAGSFKLTANATWLLCKSECVPQSALLVWATRSSKTPVFSQSADAKAFRAAAARLPASAAPLNARAFLTGKSVHLVIAGASSTHLDFFAADPGFFGVDVPSVSPHGSGSELAIPLSKYASGFPTRLIGILKRGEKRAFWVDVPILRK